MANDDYSISVKRCVQAAIDCENTEGDPAANAEAERRWERAERHKKMLRADARGERWF